MVELSHDVEIGDDLATVLRRIVASHDEGEAVDLGVVVSAADGLSAAAATFDVNCYRRTMLRRIWFEHYQFKSRTTAARLIAASWKQWKKKDPAPDGSQADYFDRMDQRGIGPKCARTVNNDLDTGEDKHRRR